MTVQRERMIREMDLRDFAPNTHKAYLSGVEGLAKHYNRNPYLISLEEIKDYLLYLKNDRGLAPSSRNVAACGLKFFYNSVLGDDSIKLELPQKKTPKKLPEVLSIEEVFRLINSAANIKHRVILMTTYSGGLRVGEVVRLKPENIDSSRMTIFVKDGKGGKDRYTLLAHSCLKELRKYWRVRETSDWLFPARNAKNHLPIGTAQKIYYKFKAKAHITKGRGIHTLRHCFATHLLEAGCDIRKILNLMGHKSLSTTSKYLHIARASLSSVKSPLDFFESDDKRKAPWEDDNDR